MQKMQVSSVNLSVNFKINASQVISYLGDNNSVEALFNSKTPRWATFEDEVDQDLFHGCYFSLFTG